jgi:hypothetical protein
LVIFWRRREQVDDARESKEASDLNDSVAYSLADDFPARDAISTEMVHLLNDQVDMDAEQTKCRSQHAANQKERQSCNLPGSQVWEPACGSDDTNAHTSQEDEDGRPHGDIINIGVGQSESDYSNRTAEPATTARSRVQG